MNPTVDEIPRSVRTEAPIGPNDRRGVWSMTAVLPLLAAFAYARPTGGLAGPASLAMGAAAFFLTIFAYYSIARLTLDGHLRHIGMSAALAVLLAIWLSGASRPWMAVMGLAMVLAGGILTGRLAALHKRPAQVYIAGAAAVAVLFTAQFGPIWADLMTSAEIAAESALAELRTLVGSLGYSEQQVADSMGAAQRMFRFVVDLIPAATIMSSVLQYSLGFLFFASWARRVRPELDMSAPFDRWRVPFGLTPFLIVAVAVRAFGDDTLRLIGDNAIAVLAIYYGVAGLALLEHYLKRHRLSIGIRIIFYVLLFLSQMIGFIAAAILGFFDSFFDWRARAEVQSI